MYLDDVFGPGGFLAQHFAAYETRPGQIALARQIDAAMQNGGHVLAEGPCGTGKSLAYAVPAIHYATTKKKRVVIATANIALQEQLVREDLPLLGRVLPWAFSFSLLKGRNNFACLDKMSGQPALLFDTDEDKRITQWSLSTKTGDVSELNFVPTPAAWARYAVGSEDCLGSDCPAFENCFYEQSRKRAATSDIVVTNYHLLFAHLAIRAETGDDMILPEFDCVVLDEAHEAAAIAREFFGFTLSELSVTRLHKYAGDKTLQAESQKFFVDLALRFPEDARLQEPNFVNAAPLRAVVDHISEDAKQQAEDDDKDKEDRARARRALRLADSVSHRISESVALADDNKVYWLERDAKSHVRIRAKPFDVSALLRQELFEKTRSVTMTSATLTTASDFSFVRRELGVTSDAREVVGESPFDFTAQCLLVVPEGIPEPNDPAFTDAAARAMEQLLTLCRGRTLGLFTSYRNMNAVYAHVQQGPFTILRQGDLPRSDLLQRFKADTHSVLFGVDSFWTGVDVPGESLSCVVIDRLPFPTPSDPWFEAIAERDPRAFTVHALPHAIMKFRQGVGRLIRTKSDVGVVVVLDRRILTKRYGREFRRSIPRMPITQNLNDISRLL